MFTPRNYEKHQKIITNAPKICKKISFWRSIWKILHLTESFYTDMSVVSVTNMRYAYNVHTPLWCPAQYAQNEQLNPNQKKVSDLSP